MPGADLALLAIVGMALVVPAAVREGGVAWVAIAAAVLVMLTTRRTMLALLLGVLAAAACRTL